MNYCLKIFAVLYVCVSTHPACAQRLVSQLPDDGVSVIYEFTLTTQFGDKTDSRNGEITVQSVGRTKSNGNPARWIELKLEYLKGEGGPINNFKVFSKLLLKEKDVANREAMAKTAEQTWVRTTFNSELSTPKNDVYPELVHLLLPQIKNVHKLEKKSFKTPLGNLSCKGSEFEFNLTKNRSNEPTTKVKYRIYANDQSPFGSVKLVVESNRSDGLKSKLDAKIKSISYKAKPFVVIPR